MERRKDDKRIKWTLTSIVGLCLMLLIQFGTFVYSYSELNAKVTRNTTFVIKNEGLNQRLCYIEEQLKDFKNIPTSLSVLNEKFSNMDRNIEELKAMINLALKNGKVTYSPTDHRMVYPAEEK